MKWWDATHRELSGWDINEFFEIADHIAPSRLMRKSDRIFMPEWLAANLAARNGRELVDNAEAAELIRSREHVARPNKGRFRHPDYLKRWRAPEPDVLAAWGKDLDSLRYGLNYRAWIGHTFVEDIVSGFAGVH